MRETSLRPARFHLQLQANERTESITVHLTRWPGEFSALMSATDAIDTRVGGSETSSIIRLSLLAGAIEARWALAGAPCLCVQCIWCTALVVSRARSARGPWLRMRCVTEECIHSATAVNVNNGAASRHAKQNTESVSPFAAASRWIIYSICA
jgi:hypothetical protein